MMRLPDKACVARRIRTMMEVRALGLSEAAKACEMPVPTLESYLKGANMPGGEGVAKLAQGLRVSADWLLSGEDH
jgi:transcriptional regulator with XRE-family HTH domain